MIEVRDACVANKALLWVGLKMCDNTVVLRRCHTTSGGGCQIGTSTNHEIPCGWVTTTFVTLSIAILTKNLTTFMRK